MKSTKHRQLRNGLLKNHILIHLQSLGHKLLLVCPKAFPSNIFALIDPDTSEKSLLKYTYQPEVDTVLASTSVPLYVFFSTTTPY